jgi:hypothetical protein
MAAPDTITNELLIEGRKAIQKSVEARATQLKKQLNDGKKISTTDEEWLDGGGNLVDEDCALESLRDSTDLVRDIESLDARRKAGVDRMVKAYHRKQALSGMHGCLFLINKSLP